MRKGLAAALLCGVLLLCACDTGPGLSLRLFCEAYNEAAAQRARLSVEQFSAEVGEDGTKFAAYVGYNEYITCEALPGGRLHTAALTGMPDVQQSEFYAAALCLLQAFTGVSGDSADRLLQELSVGNLPILGINTLERDGLRVSYAANDAGRYLRVSIIRYLPPEVEPETLRETLTY